MYNTIFDVINGLRTVLTPVGLTIYKEVKPESETGKCIVLSYMPIKKNNVNSVNDVIILLYLPKVSGMADTASIATNCNLISAALKNYDATNGVIFFNEEQEPKTDNMDGGYTVTTYIFRTINS
jgi:hypothetical protein